jgi:hypothetical protein
LVSSGSCPSATKPCRPVSKDKLQCDYIATSHWLAPAAALPPPNHADLQVNTKYVTCKLQCKEPLALSGDDQRAAHGGL